MPSLTTTIEDSSPLISYSPDWKPGSSGSDGMASLYSMSSFVATETNGGTATFSFNGTGVQVFGAKRSNHGLYQVTVDDKLYPPVNGYAPDPGEFQQSLFSVTDLPQGPHHLTLTNQGTTFVDIDFITWQTQVGSDQDKLFVNTFQDSDASFVYSPEGAWTTNVKNLGTYQGGSGHVTTTPGASLLYNFVVRDGVSLYGPIGPDGAGYSVQLDDGLMRNLSSNNLYYTPQTLLYHAGPLGPGMHRLKVLYQPNTPGQTFAIDYVNTFATSSPQQTPESSNSMSMTSRLSSGAIAGIVISIVFPLVLLLAAYLFLRRRRVRKDRVDLDNPESTAGLVNGGAEVMNVPSPYVRRLTLPPPAHAPDPSPIFRKGQVRFDVPSEKTSPVSSPSDYSSQTYPSEANSFPAPNSTCPRVRPPLRVNNLSGDPPNPRPDGGGPSLRELSHGQDEGLPPNYSQATGSP